MLIAKGVVVAGRYRLEKPLARGGMGAVWVAEHTQLDAPVAIKFMDPGLASSAPARARFEREAKAAAQIHSPHIVNVQDYGIEDDTPFLVMEMLHGEDLGSRIKRVGPLSLAVAADIIAQVARALRIAHAAGIVHRDLKPGNIFLVQNDDVEIAKVLDFGIAKTAKPVSSDEATSTDQLLGSPQYMSPEQTRRSRDVDARTDLWALGVIAYRLITGKLPFSGELGDVLVKICTEQAPPPSIHNPELSPRIDRFFERALAKSPDHRFQTAIALAQTFALAAGVNLPSVDKEPPRKQFSSTLPLGATRLPSPEDWAAAVQSRASPVAAQPAAPDAPTRPTRGPLESAPSLKPVTHGDETDDVAPESTTQRQTAPSAPWAPETSEQPDPRSLPTPTAQLPIVPTALATTRLPRLAAPDPPPREAPREAKQAPREAKPGLSWRGVALTAAGTLLALLIGTLLGGRVLVSRTAPPPTGSVSVATSVPGTLVLTTERAPLATATMLAESPPPPPQGSSTVATDPETAHAPTTTGAAAPRGRVSRTAAPRPTTMPIEISVPVVAPPPPPPPPPSSAQHRMFGTEN